MLRHLTIAIVGHAAILGALFAAAPAHAGGQRVTFPATTSVVASGEVPEIQIDFDAIEDVVAAIPED